MLASSALRNRKETKRTAQVDAMNKTNSGGGCWEYSKVEFYASQGSFQLASVNIRFGRSAMKLAPGGHSSSQQVQMGLRSEMTHLAHFKQLGHDCKFASLFITFCSRWGQKEGRSQRTPLGLGSLPTHPGLNFHGQHTAMRTQP